MKLLSIEQIREADKYTIDNEPISSINLMERAALKAYKYIVSNYNLNNSFIVFCGSGNNGGDGLAIARMLANENCNVKVVMANFKHKLSADCKTNLNRIIKNEKIKLQNAKISDSWKDFISTNFDENNSKPIIIDALFGSGLSKPIGPEFDNILKAINNSNTDVIAIDIPSGLYADKSVDKLKRIVQATETITFQTPKLAFFMPENDKYVGKLNIVDIALQPNYFQNIKTNKFIIDKPMCVKLLPPRANFAHKGTFGHALIVASSKGKTGAAVLTATACIKSGAGKVTAATPKETVQALNIVAPEIMTLEKELQKTNLNEFNAFAIGPGLNTNDIALNNLKKIIEHTNIDNKKLVIDADGLNLLSENKELLDLLPENTILTPHPKEFERLFGKVNNDFERLQLQLMMSEKYKLIIVYKNAKTMISTPCNTLYINNTGNPGMATAGSGDVLTGMIAGLLARGLTAIDAAILGVYLHGIAGDFAAEKLSQEAMTAQDIIANINNAFKTLLNKK